MIDGDLSVTYKDGGSRDVDFDAKDANGNLKSEATGAYPMDPLPSEWIPQLEENVKAAGTADKIEGCGRRNFVQRVCECADGSC